MSLALCRIVLDLQIVFRRFFRVVIPAFFFSSVCCRKARRNYEILEKFEAGIELVGSEVKSCRMSKLNMDEGFAQVGSTACSPRVHPMHRDGVGD